jgi:hypothetical protein
METKQVYTVNSPEFQQFHLRLPANLLKWLRDEAANQHRSITGEMIMALEYWRKTREIMAS